MKIAIANTFQILFYSLTGNNQEALKAVKGLTYSFMVVAGQHNFSDSKKLRPIEGDDAEEKNAEQNGSCQLLMGQRS